MPKFSFSVDSSVPPNQILAAAADCSDRRPELWPGISRKLYEVRETADTHAVVREGTDMPGGGVWAVERYDWSEPGVVRGTVVESNIFQPGGVWELRASPRPEGGSHIEVSAHRKAKGLKGHLVCGLVQAMGARPHRKSLLETLEILERERAADAGRSST
jgi:hypothetical protein